jgi:succinate dehydrogenase / fumarate reductase flavoprotein subunit
MMQDLVGIVRDDEAMRRALEELDTLKRRANHVGVTGHREYHTGWHTAQDAANLLVVSEAITRSALERKESRGGHFRQDYAKKEQAFSTFNFAVRPGSDGSMQVFRVPIPAMPAELQQIIKENE